MPVDMTPDTLPYWQGLRDGKLLLQRCAACGRFRHYPRPVCDACFSMAADWVASAATGTVESWTETHHRFLPDLAVPYTLVTATLAEGVRLLAPLRGPADGLAIGAAVECRFEEAGEWTIPTVVLA